MKIRPEGPGETIFYLFVMGGPIFFVAIFPVASIIRAIIISTWVALFPVYAFSDSIGVAKKLGYGDLPAWMIVTNRISIGLYCVLSLVALTLGLIAIL